MPLLTLNLLGGFDAQLNGKPIPDFVSNKTRALLVYLALEADQVHSRSHLAGLFWPENPERRSRTNLRHALANLRKLLQDRQAKMPFVNVTTQTLQFDTNASYHIDVLLLEEQLSTLETGAFSRAENAKW